jgi:DNA-binding transcriptional regulator YdaS (Cro superfamily)
MDLWQWLERERIRPSHFAKLIKRHHSTISHWKSGGKRPDWESLDRIAEATNGEVTSADFARNGV